MDAASRWIDGKATSLDIRLEPGQTYGRSECLACGRTFMLDGVRLGAYDRFAHSIGDICPECLETGEVGLRERLCSRALEVPDAIERGGGPSEEPLALPVLDEVHQRQARAREAFARELRLARANARLDRDLDGQAGH